MKFSLLGIVGACLVNVQSESAIIIIDAGSFVRGSILINSFSGVTISTVGTYRHL